MENVRDIKIKRNLLVNLVWEDQASLYTSEICLCQRVTQDKTRASNGSSRTFRKVTYEILIFEGKKIKIEVRKSSSLPTIR